MGKVPLRSRLCTSELAPLLQWLLIATNPIIWDFRQDMGCLALIFGEATFLGHIKLGHKYQLNHAFAPLYVTNALCNVKIQYPNKDLISPVCQVHPVLPRHLMAPNVDVVPDVERQQVGDDNHFLEQVPRTVMLMKINICYVYYT